MAKIVDDDNAPSLEDIAVVGTCDHDSEVDEINAKFNGVFRLLLVFAAVLIFLIHYIAQIYCGVTGKPFVVSSETNYMVIAFVVAAIGGESAVQAYKVWKKR